MNTPAITGTATTSDGLKLHTVHWLPPGEPRGIVYLVHGIGEHVGRYAHVAAHLNAHGYALYAHDHRGHGKSEGTRTYFDSFDLPVEDMRPLAAAAQAAHPGKPLFIYGHSMGSLISAMYLLKYASGVAGWISSGSPVSLDQAVPGPLVSLIKVVGGIAPKLPFIKLDAGLLAHDPAVIAAYRTDPLVDQRASRIGMVARLASNGQQVLAQAAQLKLPMLLLHGTADGICPVVGSQKLHERAGSNDKTLKLYPNLYHELHNEPDKAVIFADMVEWLNARTSGN